MVFIPFANGAEVPMGGGGPTPRTDPLQKAFTLKFENVTQSGTYFLTLFVNPEEFSMQEPARTTVTQTKGGAFVDQFGRGLPIITLRGTTGFHDRAFGSRKVSGQQNALDLRWLYRNYLSRSVNEPDKTKITFYNHADNEAWEVVITNFVMLRNVARPLLYQYTLTMTALRYVGEKLKEFTSGLTADDYTSGVFTTPGARVPLALNQLTKETGFIDSVLNGLMDITGLSSGAQTWSALINKGQQYYNSISKTYQTVASAISQVEDLAKTIQMYVQGATNFITAPVDLVQDAAQACGDIAYAMSSVADIPHEFIRSFREMACALMAIPEAVFQGFTNPYIFEGESNCGASMGVPGAPVANTPNSFTATAQLPPQRLLSQVFDLPQLNLTLREDPISVSGIFLATDVSRTGNNYLSKWAGRQVTLTSVPNSAIVIDYEGYQATSAFQKITLRTARSYGILNGDTLERIALKQYGNSSRWKEIALFNNLEYPFIADLDFQTNYKSSGFVRFYRKSGYLNAVDIPKDTIVWSPAYQGTNQINFVVTQDTTLHVSAPYVDVPVEAYQDGEAGDVGPGRITGFTGFDSSIQKISNVSAMLGGKIWKVAKPGDVIQIPDTAVPSTNNIVSAAKNYNELFGIDVMLKDGEFAPGSEGNPDLQRAYGIDNLKQALINRLHTTLGFYVYHSNYGSNLPKYIGQKNINYWENIVSWDIQDVCLLDPRIDNLQNFILKADGDEIEVEFDAIPINENNSLSINIIV